MKRYLTCFVILMMSLWNITTAHNNSSPIRLSEAVSQPDSDNPDPDNPDPDNPDPDNPDPDNPDPDNPDPDNPDPDNPDPDNPDPDNPDPDNPDPNNPVPDNPDPDNPVPDNPDPDNPDPDNPDPDNPDPEEPVWPATMASGTLPIIYINTEDSVPIIDKETKIPAYLWIEIPEGCEEKDFALGSEENPVKLEIKGRGNSTWTRPKKPYKLKFDSKTEILGMPKHKHFALLAHYGDASLWLGVEAGFEMARQLDMPWAPRSQAAELVLNGSYEGLYFLTESIKIDKNRLNIYEQPEENIDPETIPYGWLVEIDNYPDEFQTIVPYTKTKNMRITHQAPEILSDEQKEWIYNEFSTIVQTISCGDTVEDWVNHFDAPSLARYFIVRELLCDNDGFNGSMYMYKDLGADKWSFGPMWDCTLCLPNSNKEITWTKDSLPDYVWWKFLPEIFNTKNFNDAFHQEWETFYPDKLYTLTDYINTLSNRVSTAFEITRERWGNAYLDMKPYFANNCLNVIYNKAKWMDEHKDFYKVEVSSPTVSVDAQDVISVTYFTPVGTQIVNPTAGFIYLKVEKLTDGTTRCTKTVF